MAAWRSKTNTVSTARPLTAQDVLGERRCRYSVNARATTAEIVHPLPWAYSRTRAASDAGTLTVNTTLTSGTSTGPATAASTYRRPCRTDTENRCATTRAASTGSQTRGQQPGRRIDPLGILHVVHTSTRHAINILLDMSLTPAATPR